MVRTSRCGRENPGSNPGYGRHGPLDLLSIAIYSPVPSPPCSLLKVYYDKKRRRSHTTCRWNDATSGVASEDAESRATSGPTEIRTRVAGFKVLSANHYTMGPGVCTFKANTKVNVEGGCRGRMDEEDEAAIYAPRELDWHLLHEACDVTALWPNG